MDSPQKLQNAFQKYQNGEKIDNDCFILTPKAPNLRPSDSPNIDFEDFLLPEPLLGEEAFEEEDYAEELEDFFLEEAPSQQTIESSSGQILTRAETKNKRDQSQKGKVERFCPRSSIQNNFSVYENTNFNSLQNADYQMSQITENLKCSAEGVVELIFRKKSISI